MAVNFGTQAHDYLETLKGLNNNSPGFQPGVKKKAKPVLAGFSMAKPKIVTKHKI